MIKVLFICHGNICRSTMAEYVMKDLVEKSNLAEEFYIDSAATSREEIGNPVHHGTQQKLKEKGIFCGDHRARQVTKKEYEEYDYILGMDSWNMKNMMKIFGNDADNKIHKLLDFSSSPRDIADPWYTGNFEITYNDVSEGCQELLNYILEKGQVTRN
ncbi:low molecular weight protein-tyrosine-phosphatase [Faecalimonas sp.]